MPEQLWEQKGLPAQFPAVQARQQNAYRRPIHTDDVDEDTLYETRFPNSTRRYAPASPQRTIVRVTHHQVPPRASLRQALTQDEQDIPLQQSTALRQRPHWLIPVSVGMLCMLVLSLVGNMVYSVGVNTYNDMHYGYPRTFQCDANVGHGGESHFVAQNLHGRVFVIEMHINNPGKTMIYVGPTLTGPRADREPVTVSFQSENGDKLPDMLLQVGAMEYVYPNTGQGFRITTQPSKIGV
jgi:hypothetical protein